VTGFREYIPRTAAPLPFAHQRECLEQGGNKFVYALLMEAGTAKSRIIIDNAAWLFDRGVITGLLVSAPNDVAAQWLEEQIPLYMPERIKVRAALWDADSKRAERLCAELLLPVAGRLHVLAVNHEAFATARAVRLFRKFLQTHRSMFVLDEAHDFSNPKAARVKAVLELGPLAPVRRILTGTPFEKPFDLYTQFEFLDPRILGFASHFAFRHHYAVFAKEFVTKTLRDKRTGQPVKRLIEYESLQHYQRLEELWSRVAKYSYRKALAACADLPPKLYIKLPTHLSAAQQALYEAIKAQGFALLAAAEQGKPVKLLDVGVLDDEELIEAVRQGGNKITAAIKLVTTLRLQQCMGGFCTDDERTVRCTEGKAEDIPRVQATRDYALQCLAGPGKVIIWAQFRAELEALAAVMQAAGAATVMIHGGVVGKERAEAIEAFKAPKSTVRVLVAHPYTMGTGQNLQVARTLIYYSNGWRWVKREQSERRAHRVGQTGTVRVVDLQARGAPLDARLLENFAQRGELVGVLMGWGGFD
jgi:superfamily II DNA or RNA helicase